MKKIFAIFVTFMCISACADATIPERLVINHLGAITTSNDSNVTIIQTKSAGEIARGIYNLGNVTSLIIIGDINASDFRFIKWNCINLEAIDLSNAVIKEYTGTAGTNEGYNATYAENEIPMGAFFYWMDKIENGVMTENETKYFDEGMPSLKSVKLPVGIKAIRRNAFARAYNLTEINIPEGVEIIDYVSFRYCSSLTEITLPSTIKTLGQWAFTALPNLKTVYCKSSVPPSTNQSFGELYDSNNRGWVYIPTYNTNKKIEALYVPKGCKQAYESWTEYFETIIEINF